MAKNIGRDKNSFSWKAILAILGILGIFVGMVFYLDWAWDTYGRDYALSLASLFVAIVIGLAVIYTLRLTKESLETTRESLALTKATQRPFLNICQFGVNWSRNDGQPTSVNNFIVGLCNTGAFPADQVSVLMKVSKNDMDNQQHLFSATEGIPTICFPSDEIINLHFKKVDEKEKLEVELKGELKVRIEIEYKNKLTEETYKTNRSYLVQYGPTARGAPTPIPKEDYWD